MAGNDETPPSDAVDKLKAQSGIPAALEKLAQGRPGAVTEMVSMMGIGPMANPLHGKMTPEHITQVLELAAKHDEREYNLHKSEQDNDAQDRKSTRRYAFAAFVVITILILVILVLFRDKPSILIPTLTGVIGLTTGFAGGFGVGRWRSD